MVSSTGKSMCEACTTGWALGLAHADVVAVEGDVDVAERDRLAHELGDQVAQRVRRARRRDGGSRRPRSPRRPSSRRSRGRCAPACAACPRGRGPSSRSTSRPFLASQDRVKGTAARLSACRDAARLARRARAPARRARGAGSRPVEVARDDHALERLPRLVAQLARRVARRDVREREHRHLGRGGQLGRAAGRRVAGLGGPLRRPPRGTWPRARAGRRRRPRAASSRRARCRPRAPPCARAARSPITCSGAHAVHRLAALEAAEVGAGRRRPARAARSGSKWPGPRVLDQRVAERRRAVVHLERRRSGSRRARAPRSAPARPARPRTAVLPIIGASTREQPLAARAARRRSAAARAGAG